MKILCKTLLITLFIPLVAISKIVYLESDTETIQSNNSSISIVKPKSRTWTELQNLLKNDISSNKELSIQNCALLTTSNLTYQGSYSQNILYQDYRWNTYTDDNNNLCIELTQPSIGLLTDSTKYWFTRCI